MLVLTTFFQSSSQTSSSALVHYNPLSIITRGTIPPLSLASSSDTSSIFLQNLSVSSSTSTLPTDLFSPCFPLAYQVFPLNLWHTFQYTKHTKHTYFIGTKRYHFQECRLTLNEDRLSNTGRSLSSSPFASTSSSTPPTTTPLTMRCHRCSKHASAVCIGTCGSRRCHWSKSIFTFFPALLFACGNADTT